jgi:hypothetical protein
VAPEAARGEGIMTNQQPPWDPFSRQDTHPTQSQPQYPQQQPYGQQTPYVQQPPPTQGVPFGFGPQPGDPGQQGQPQQPYPQEQPPYGQQTYPPPGPPQPPFIGPQHGQGPQASWPARHKVLTGLIGAGAFIIVLAAIGAASASGSTKTVTDPGPTVTVTQPGTQVTVTVTATATATATVQATANAQGEATQISADGVYVVGQDIPGGTWHTSGGAQCYEATLSGLDPINDIISNDNFAGPDTVDLSGAKAFDINGGCTWQQEG